MRVLILSVLLLATCTAADHGNRIVAVPKAKASAAVADDMKLTVGEFSVFGLKLDAKDVSWEIDPVYEIGYDKAGKPILVSGDAGIKEIEKPFTLAKLIDNEPVFIDVVPGNHVLLWGKAAGKVKLTARSNNKRIDQRVIEVSGPRGPPVVPPVVTPPAPAKGLYFLLVGPDGPALPEIEKSLSLPVVAEMQKAGHQFKYQPISEVKTKNGQAPVPAGTSLPCLLVLRIGVDEATVIPPPRAVPRTDDEWRKAGEQ